MNVLEASIFFRNNTLRYFYCKSSNKPEASAKGQDDRFKHWNVRESALKQETTIRINGNKGTQLVWAKSAKRLIQCKRCQSSAKKKKEIQPFV